MVLSSFGIAVAGMVGFGSYYRTHFDSSKNPVDSVAK